jgi:hypothetical protein
MKQGLEVVCHNGVHFCGAVGNGCKYMCPRCQKQIRDRYIYPYTLNGLMIGARHAKGKETRKRP